MLNLILVRHGETDSNRKGTYMGWTDVELNSVGLSQAYCTREKLRNEKVEHIISSPLKRAAKTAEIINENFGLDIIYSESLKERNFGVWDDLPLEAIMERYREDYEMWRQDWKNYSIDGGESACQAYERITGYVDDLVNRYSDSTVIIVTHLGCIRKITAHLLGMGIDGSWHFRVDNCGITRITINDERYAYLTQLNA